MSIYALPKDAVKLITTAIAPFGLGKKSKTLLAIQAIMEMIGRAHTAPGTFDQRGDGQGNDPGFVLCRRALSGPNAPPECARFKVTENAAREAIARLQQCGLIERVTPRAMLTSTDNLGRRGWWLKATVRKDEKGKPIGIRAPAVRYKLTAKLASIFRRALKRFEPGERIPAKPVRPPVGMIPTYQDKTDIGTVRVTTGGQVETPEPQPRSLVSVPISRFLAPYIEKMKREQS